MTERIEVTTPDPLAGEETLEQSLRPARLAEFVGQEKVKEALDVYIRAALGREEALDHALFFGPPGLGKTTLAILMARELGVNIKVTSGPVLEKPGDLAALLTNLEPRDILFIDEIHRLRPVIEEYLYPAMEDFRIEIRLSDGARDQTVSMRIERFTLVGATTRFGLLTAPMRARFGVVERLGYYPAEDLQKIVTRSASILGVPVREADGRISGHPSALTSPMRTCPSPTRFVGSMPVTSSNVPSPRLCKRRKTNAEVSLFGKSMDTRSG